MPKKPANDNKSKARSKPKEKSKPGLGALRNEVNEEQGAIDEAADKADLEAAGEGDPEAAPVQLTADNLNVVSSAFVSALGGVVCKRAKVSPLAPEEAQEVGAALANVLAQYEIMLTPMVAAWLSLCLVSMKVVSAREPLDTPEPDAADPRVDSGQGEPLEAQEGPFEPDEARSAEELEYGRAGAFGQP